MAGTTDKVFGFGHHKEDEKPQVPHAGHTGGEYAQQQAVKPEHGGYGTGTAQGAGAGTHTTTGTEGQQKPGMKDKITGGIKKVKDKVKSGDSSSSSSEDEGNTAGAKKKHGII